VLTWALGQHSNLLPLDETGWLSKFATDIRTTYVLGKQGAQLARMGIKEPDFYATFAEAINELVMRHGGYGSQFARDVDERSPLLRYRSPADTKARWIDASPDYSFRVFELLELFPEARFIHMLRDVRLVVESLVRLDRAASSSRRAELYGEWHRFSQACAESERAFGSRVVLRSSFADLVSDPERALRRCLEFLGEQYSPDCLDPVRYLVDSSAPPSTPKAPPELAESPVVAKAIEFNEELLSDPEPDYEPDAGSQVDLGAKTTDDYPIPVEGPIAQEGHTTGLCDDSWVDGALTATLRAEEEIREVTIEAALPSSRHEEQEATLYLRLGDDDFRETFALGEEISWTVPCGIPKKEHARMRLHSSRTVRLCDEGLGDDERELVLHLRRMSFSS
jgi:sulfotransferase family protein